MNNNITYYWTYRDEENRVVVSAFSRSEIRALRRNLSTDGVSLRLFKQAIQFGDPTPAR